MEGERYHLFSRGVEKRLVFMDTQDYDRFVLLLFLSNNKDNVHMANLIEKYKNQGFPLMRAFAMEKRAPIVDIEAYALMPNHIHLLVRQTNEGGISKFMLKLMTAYSMYFNIKYERSGPLFTRPFRSRYIDDDAYFRWVFSYINLNPLELYQSDWKQTGIRDRRQAQKFMWSYTYSSFLDYFSVERPQSMILQKTKELSMRELQTFDQLVSSLAASQHQGEPLM